MTTEAQYAAQIVAEARSKLGVPYVYGVTDCEWLTRICAASIGVTIPSGSSEQFAAFPHCKAPYEPGDLLYFQGSDSPGPGKPGHCGVNIGAGHFIDAPYTGVDVRTDAWSPSTKTGDLAFYGAIRIAERGKAIPTPAEPTLYLFRPYLTGAAVKLCQEDLVKHGFKADLGATGIDGIFGVATEKAVKAFQAKAKLSVDGTVGPLTWKALAA